MPWFEIWYVATDGHNISVEVQAPSLTAAIDTRHDIRDIEAIFPLPPDTD